LPLPIPIDWVKDEPAPVLEIVSVGAEETTDESLVGKFPAIAVPFALTLGPAGVDGDVAAEETTEASSVAKRVAALAVGEGDGAAAAIGDGSGVSGAETFC
jgi:hypothetical protein